MSFFKEFKEFALRGNVIDLAVGVIIGGAFGKITDSLINDIMMPLLGKVVGSEIDFSNHYIPLSKKVPEGLALVDAKKLGPVFAYGNFITIIINFFMLAFCVFLLVKGINSLHKKKQAEAEVKPAEMSSTDKLLAEIRDELKKNPI